jgi:hypothetical protein
LHLGQDANAITTAEAALLLRPDDPRALYIIGFVLFLNHGPMDEVRRLLGIAGRTLPEARATLDKIAAGKLVPRPIPR